MNNRKLLDSTTEVTVKGNLTAFTPSEGNLRKLTCGVYLPGITLLSNRLSKAL